MTRVPLLALLGIGMTFSLSAVQPLPTFAQDSTPAADCVTTTPDENKAMVEAWFAALSSGSGEGVGELAAEDIVYHDPSPDAETQEGGAEEWADDRQADYPDMQVTVEQMLAEGDMVASMQRYTGTQSGDVEDEMACQLPA
jgi:ketosteroid isomerase-like protein